MRFAVIMAGGSGTRLWPLSRKSQPKQLLPLVGGKSLMAIAVERLDGLFEPEQIFVVTNAEYADQVAAALPHIPRENIIGEPVGRDTANAVALATAVLSGKDENATMAVFTADHVIRPQDCFEQAVRGAMDAAEANPGALLTFGVKPTWPHTGLGYIECGEEVSTGVCTVESFREKPDHTTARMYVESSSYLWNSGMFVWTLPSIRAELESNLSDSVEKLDPIRQAVARGDDIQALLEEVYPSLEKISIDYAVMEKAKQVMVVRLRCEWIDLGSWGAMEEVVEPDGQGNVIHAENHVAMDSFRNVLVSSDDHLLAVMGIDDCVVVHSSDATLVCRKSDSQRLKELVKAVENHFDARYI